MHWRRKWQPTPVSLPGESQGREAWWAAIYGVAQSWTQWSDLAATAAATNTWKDAQYRSLLEKCKSKLQWDITSHQSEWPSSKSLQTINAGEVVEKRELSCTVGGNVNWYSHCGRQYGDSLKRKKKNPTRNKTIIWPSNPTPRHICWGNQNWKRHMYPNVHCSTIYS